MPILWRFLLKQYFKLFFLCVGAFVSFLLIMRTQEIARFATLNASLIQVLLFTLCQLPYILPFAIPISGLISSTILSQTLSQTHELTALRACGSSIRRFLAPLIIASLFLSLINFLVISELGPYCKLQAISLLHQSVCDNPLMLLRKKKFLAVKDRFVDMTLSTDVNHAQNLLFAFLDPSSHKLSLITAKQLYLEQGFLKGSNLAMISSLESQEHWDDLLIENQRTMSLDSGKLSSLLKPSSRRVRYEQLPTKLCLIKMHLDSPSHTTTKKGLFELYKRSFFTFAPMTFILLGTCFGMRIGRHSHKKDAITITFLTVLLFLGYILGKTLHKTPFLALLCYTLPQILVLILCLLSIKKLQQGIE